MFALLPLPPTDHQLQQRRLRYEYGEDAMTARQRTGTRQLTEHRPAIRVRLTMAAMLVRVGERLMGSPSGNPTVPGLETAIDPGTAPAPSGGSSAGSSGQASSSVLPCLPLLQTTPEQSTA